MKKQSDWMPLNFDAAEFRRRIRVHGRDIDVVVSPYDIPEAVRVSLDESSLRVTIEFRYINQDEAEIRESLPNGIFIALGKVSNRLYSVDFPVSSRNEKLDERFLQVGAVIGEYAAQQMFRRSNSAMVQSAITHASDFELSY